MTSGPDRSYERILSRLRDYAGFVFSALRRPGVCEEIERRARQHGMTVTDYAAALERDRGKLAELAEALTVNESYFYRDPLQLQFIGTKILPELFARVGDAAPLQIWSAGCAAGEEVYTLAFLAEGALAAPSRILGTDISSAALERARAGIYGTRAVRSLPPTLLTRYFQQQGGRYRLQPDFSARIEFRYMNLAEMDRPPGLVHEFDLILCRNVLIYLDASVVKRVLANFVRWLRPGGWLVLGPSDPLALRTPGLETVVTPDGLYYRKPVTGAEQCEPRMVASDLLPAQDCSGPQALEDALPSLAPPDEILGLPPIARIRHDATSAGTEEQAEALCREHPLRPDLHFYLGLLHLSARKPAQAEQCLRRALYLDPTLAAAHFALGLALERGGRLARSCSAYRRAAVAAEALPPEAVVPLTDGETAERLAAAARKRMHTLAPRSLDRA